MSAPIRRPRLLRWLTRLYPPAFRDRFEDEMLEVLEEDHRSRRTRTQKISFWRRSIGGTLSTALREHAADLRPELRHVVRTLRRRPLFLGVSVVSLGVGIGATATVFATVGAFFLQPIAGIDEPQRLINIKPYSKVQEAWESESFPNYFDLQEQLPSVEEVAAFSGRGLAIRVDENDAPRSALVQLTTANFATTVGIQPSRGRYFTATESEAAARVALVSHRFWVERLGSSDDLGEILVNGARFQVIGVGPQDFRGIFKGFPSDVFLPIGNHRLLGLPDREDRSVRWLELVGRLEAGASLDAATAEVETAGFNLAEMHPASNRDITLHVERTTGMDADYRMGLLVFLSILGVLCLAILGIATFNLAGMMAGRNLERRGEAALRRALGAPGSWLARRAFLESLLLAAGGALLGTGIALAATPRVGRTFQLLDERIDMPVSVDSRTLVGIAVLALFTALAATVVALRSGRAPQLSSLGRGSLGGRQWGRRALVIGQVVLSFTVLTAAGLFFGASRQAARTATGFEADRVVTALLDPRLIQLEADESRLFFERMLNRVEADPAVARVALTTRVPLGLGARFFPNRVEVGVPGLESPPGTDGFSVEHARVSAGFFDVLGIDLEEGRDFSERTAYAAASDEPLELIVNRAFVERYFDDGVALGRELIVDGRAGTIRAVTPTTRVRTLDEAPRPMIYLSLEQRPAGRAVLLARAAGPLDPVLGVVEAVQRAAAPDLPVQELQPLRDIVATGHLPQRVGAATTGVLGLLGLLLCSVGLYGVVAEWLAARTPEIGLRATLGAAPTDLVRLVLGQGLALSFWGVALGIPLSIALATSIRGFLYDLSPVRPLLYLGLASLVVGVTLVACAGPARRARRVRPLDAIQRG